MNTPILKAKKGKEQLNFYNDGEYNNWKQSNNDGKGWDNEANGRDNEGSGWDNERNGWCNDTFSSKSNVSVKK